MNKADMLEILSQPFVYLTEGLQTFVYLSKDKKYILKTLKNLEQSKRQFEEWGLDPKNITNVLIENSEKSYVLAFNKLKSQTALLDVHISDEPLSVKNLVLGNKEYDAQTLQFILQEKVELVRDRLNRLKNENKITECKKVIDDIIELISFIWGKDITEDTFNWDHNYGYTKAGNLAQIDVGTFWIGRESIQNEISKRKLLNSISSKKLGVDFPEIYTYYKKEIEKLYKKFED